MFSKLKLKNLVYCVKNQNVYMGKLLHGGVILDIHFRRNLLEKSIYSFAGICLSVRRSNISSTVLIRNVISLYTLEYMFNLFSPLAKIVIRETFNTKKAKYYFLRTKPAPFSKINFQYILYK